MFIKKYHESKMAIYYKLSNGAVIVEYKGKNLNRGIKKVVVSNDTDGHWLIESVLKPLGIRKMLYRCPNDGNTYSHDGTYNRRGNIRKHRAKTIDVYIK
jgi:hypothetical protein